MFSPKEVNPQLFASAPRRLRRYEFEFFRAKNFLVCFPPENSRKSAASFRHNRRKPACSSPDIPPVLPPDIGCYFWRRTNIWRGVLARSGAKISRCGRGRPRSKWRVLYCSPRIASSVALYGSCYVLFLHNKAIPVHLSTDMALLLRYAFDSLRQRRSLPHYPIP